MPVNDADTTVITLCPAIVPRYAKGERLCFSIGGGDLGEKSIKEFTVLSRKVYWNIFTSPEGQILNLPQKPTVMYTLRYEDRCFLFRDEVLAQLIGNIHWGYAFEKVPGEAGDITMKFEPIAALFSTGLTVSIRYGSNLREKKSEIIGVRVIRRFSTSLGGRFKAVFDGYKSEYLFQPRNRVFVWVPDHNISL